MPSPEAPSWPAALLSADHTEALAATEQGLAQPPDAALLPTLLAALAALPIPNPRFDPLPPLAQRLLALLAHTLQAIPPGPLRDKLIATARAAQADQHRHDVFSAHLDLLSALRACGAISTAALRHAWEAHPALRLRGALTELLLREGLHLPPHLLLEQGMHRRELHQPYARHVHGGDPGTEAIALYRHGDLLDLSGTGLDAWPASASTLRGIRRLDLRGTRIRQVPADFRAGLKEVRARKSALIALRMQVVEDGACAGDFEQEMQVRHGMLLFRRGRRAEALEHFRLGIGRAGGMRAGAKGAGSALELVLACAAAAGDWALCLKVIAEGRPIPQPHNPYRRPTQRRDKSVAEYWPSLHASSFHAVMAGRIGEWKVALHAYWAEEDPFSSGAWWSWQRHFRRMLELGREDEAAVFFREARRHCRDLALAHWDWLWALRHLEARGRPDAALRIFLLADPLPAKPEGNNHWPRLLRFMRAYLACFTANGDAASARMLAGRLPAYARKAEAEAKKTHQAAALLHIAQQLEALAIQYSSH